MKKSRPVDLSRWQEIHQNYHYPDPTPIFERTRRKPASATAEDSDIINAIALWKYNRQVHILPDIIEKLNHIATSVRSPEEVVVNEEVGQLVDDLIDIKRVGLTKGVGLALASTILKFYCRHAFPIIDRRAYRQALELCKGAQGGSEQDPPRLRPDADSVVYLRYIRRCIEIGNRFHIPFPMVDEVLYQVDKESGRSLEERQA